MSDAVLPLIIEPEKLEKHLGDKDLLVVDLCKASSYARGHIPGAVHLDYEQIVAEHPPVRGLLPEEEQLGELLSAIGLTPATHVVAYDDEGGGRAGRLLWTLEVIGHSRYSLLNGGLHAWTDEGHPLTDEPAAVTPSDCRVSLGDSEAVADRDYILAHLGDPAVALLDARSPEEYSGEAPLAMRAGHIPGAVNIEWTSAMDRGHKLRLKPEAELRALLKQRGVTPDKTVVVYCQTHHRSAHTYIMLRSLGYPRVKGYPGSWSDWGNQPNTPVEK